MFVAGLRRQVGWFVILGFGAIVLILLLLSLRTDLFAKKFYLSFSPPSATAFYVGQPVKFQGFSIGRIDEMNLMPDGKVHISMRLLERYRTMLHEGSMVQLVRDGLIGEQTLEITAGDKQRPVVTNGDAVAYETAATVEQLLQDMKPAIEHANTLLRELASLATWMNDPNSDIRQMTARLNSISQDLNRKNVGEVVGRMSDVMENLQALTQGLKEQRVAEQLAATLKITTRILSDLRPLSEQIAKEGPASIARINSLIEHVDRLSRSLDVVASDLSELTPELPGLARESRATIGQMQELLQGLRGSWLIGGSKHDRPVKPEPAAPAMDMQP